MMPLRKPLLMLMFLSLLFSGEASRSTPAEAAPAVMSLEECIETALLRHPDLAAGRAGVVASEARAGQTRTGFYPSIGFSTAFSERSSSGTGSSEGSWSSAITLSQMVTDWGRTHAMLRRSLLDVAVKTLELETTRSDIVYEVTRSYFQLLKAGKELDVAEESLALNDERLEQAEAFFRVGRVSRYDVTAAQVTRSNANLALIRARTAQKEAMTALKAAMGLTDAVEFDIAGIDDDPDPGTQGGFPSLEWAIGSALENRPDLIAYKVNTESAETSVLLAGLDNAPQLSLSGSYGWGSADFWGQDTWRAGLTLSFPIYDGGLQREKKREARANLEGAQARLESYTQRVVSDVTSAWLAASDSAETVAAAAEGLQMALDNLEIAKGRYQVGVGSPLEVSDATRNYTEAKAAWYSALYDGMTARAALEKAMGVVRK